MLPLHMRLQRAKEASSNIGSKRSNPAQKLQGMASPQQMQGCHGGLQQMASSHTPETHSQGATGDGVAHQNLKQVGAHQNLKQVGGHQSAVRKAIAGRTRIAAEVGGRSAEDRGRSPVPPPWSADPRHRWSCRRSTGHGGRGRRWSSRTSAGRGGHHQNPPRHQGNGKPYDAAMDESASSS